MPHASGAVRRDSCCVVVSVGNAGGVITMCCLHCFRCLSVTVLGPPEPSSDATVCVDAGEAVLEPCALLWWLLKDLLRIHLWISLRGAAAGC